MKIFFHYFILLIYLVQYYSIFKKTKNYILSQCIIQIVFRILIVFKYKLATSIGLNSLFENELR